jgi:hypothetical protein
VRLHFLCVIALCSCSIAAGCGHHDASAARPRPSAAGSETAPDGHALFPMGVGYRWVYGTGERAPDVVFTVVGEEPEGAARRYRVLRTGEGDPLLFELSVAADGVRVHRIGNDPFEPPFLQFTFQPGSRRTYSGAFGGKAVTIATAELGEREIPSSHGGATRAYFVVEETTYVSRASEPPDHTEYWLTPGAGVIGLQGKRFDPHSARREAHAWELKSFTRGTTR